MTNVKWPVLKSYEGKYLRRVSMPLGGIGTGTVSLGGRGNLQDWAIMNVPAVGYTPFLHGGNSGFRETGPFFAIHSDWGDSSVTRVLEGPIDSEYYETSEGMETPNHGLPRFAEARLETAYPLAKVTLSDPEIPLDIRLEAFNPLVPGNSDDSGIPGAVLRYRVVNQSDRPAKVAISGNLLNMVGQDGREYRRDWRWSNKKKYLGSRRNRNRFRSTDGLNGLFMDSRGVRRRSSTWGSMALVLVPEPESRREGAPKLPPGLTYRSSWEARTWGNSTRDFWDDFSDDGLLKERRGKSPYNRMASLADRRELAPGEETVFTFIISWHFPNRLVWHSPELKLFGRILRLGTRPIGNYYTTRFADAWQAAAYMAGHIRELERKTLAFVDAFCGSDLPEPIREAALFNLSTLRSQTCYRTPDGSLWGWEGIHDTYGSCMGSCTHVWNYEQATPYLFGDLARSMRGNEYRLATRRNGHMGFRIFQPLWLNRLVLHPAAADGQMGCVMKTWREWQLSGDHDFLLKLWPKVKKSLEFAWLPGGWDADRDGVMEGCQHNTMDVEYYGPNPQMQGWYLGALKAAASMADAMEDSDFSDLCLARYREGRKFMEEKLFNGDFFEQQVRVPVRIRRGLKASMGARNLDDPILQIGPGCLVDQLVGPATASFIGLDELLSAEQVRTTLKSITKYNYRKSLRGHFNPMRTYALNDESAMLMASWPRGGKPEQPFPYADEVMTGFEHSTAAHMIAAGLEDEGLRAITAIRSRYDGYKRNPFDEAECGHHYARAMASWASVLAWTGFRWSGVTGEMDFSDRPGRWFWSNGSAWGTVDISTGGNSESRRFNLELLEGELEIRKLNIGDREVWSGNRKMNTGDRIDVQEGS